MVGVDEGDEPGVDFPESELFAFEIALEKLPCFFPSELAPSSSLDPPRGRRLGLVAVGRPLTEVFALELMGGGA